MGSLASTILGFNVSIAFSDPALSNFELFPRPFGRLGMDDIVATVVTRPEPHNQVWTVRVSQYRGMCSI